MNGQEINQKKDKPVVVGLGEVLWDRLPEGKQMGGAPGNFAFHAGALGADACIVARVGNDPDGTELLQCLKALCIETGFIQVDPDHPTGAVDVVVDGAGQPTYTIVENSAWDIITMNDQLEELASGTEAVCFGTLAQRQPQSRETIQAFLRRVPQKALRILDVNLRQNYYSAGLIRDSIALSNVLKLNDEEAPIIGNALGISGSPHLIAEKLTKKADLKLTALTMGERGSLLITPEDISEREAAPVTVVDAVGAGDAFTAALAMGLLAGSPLSDIHRRADRLASFVCSQKGATPSHDPVFLKEQP